MFGAPHPRTHICGLYYILPSPNYYQPQRHYLPLLSLKSHTTILSNTSRTTLTQTFANPSSTKAIKQLRYTFPLYDGVSVVSFVCHIGSRVIRGVVKEAEKAKSDFNEAVERGETAGLLEQLPDAADVFTTTVGNVPAGATVVVEITYLGELKHDSEVNGIRFTIPTAIAPRYGSYPGSLSDGRGLEAAAKGGIEITVDAKMAPGAFVKKLQSPTHPIAVSMGTLSSAPDADPEMHQASATLSLGTTELEKDFVLQLVTKETGTPQALLETHPRIPNQRALMATLVPRFSLEQTRPEIVFICDRSGSMGGRRISTLIPALKVFLRSMPPNGVKFNICSFGSRHSFLWSKSKTYSQKTLDEAIKHVDRFTADFGGTEMMAPIKATIENRYEDIPLEIMLLTDGEIWDQQTLFGYLNGQIQVSKSPIRLFTLGIGEAVSHALIEGLARAGNGFSQTVGDGEKMDSKVVRMLNGALTPHIDNYTIEIEYSNEDKVDDDDDDFEIIEKVTDSLKTNLDISDKKTQSEKPKQTISLFDTSADPNKVEPHSSGEDGQGKYSHLPPLSPPKLLQAPHKMPSLFPFTRTTVYLLLGPDTAQRTPKSVLLKGTYDNKSLELSIPVEVLSTLSETIHQLAAKKAIQELEEGRGWLTEARTADGKLIKEALESRFEDFVEREAVRLGVQYQVGGKWCSFVALEANEKGDRDSDSKTLVEEEGYLDEPTEAELESSHNQEPGRLNLFGGAMQSIGGHGRGGGFSTRGSASLPSAPRARLSRSAVPPPPPQASAAAFGATPALHAAVWGAPESWSLRSPAPSGAAQAQFSASAFPGSAALSNTGSVRMRDLDESVDACMIPASATTASLPQPKAGGLFGNSSAFRMKSFFSKDSKRKKSANTASEGDTLPSNLFGGIMSAGSSESSGLTPPALSDDEKTREIIALQAFDGAFAWSETLFRVIGVERGDVERVFAGVDRVGGREGVWATVLAVVFLERRLPDQEEDWVLVVGKARRWLEANCEEGVRGELEKAAEGLV
ncbi:hypothetical protein M501DRAFT_1013297 [Patellaria atrata CBS 101060]|uniref:VIT-domain-containing protein n=1 Tax=Patellaria atrata CBS 101060 TaxID=1346257 RepID=A0A9P4SGE6_9PEZI|nr:hypothetical protein M501DRAFT_1013297 [Patellaria atrata CBS 101060]